MEYAHAKIRKVFESSDRKARVNVLERQDGLFEFRAYVERYEEGAYWSPTEISGLYESAEEAERGALNEVPWLRQFCGGGRT
ncbi:MAG: hypothetical protein P4M07_04560 [Xanthobacteraceae bacterium]|nr:hypothetical protein [Xanthobacteraceae bacterium]